ncbi:MAG: S41 family peptidase [Verrucomicrobiales bacterium]|nr:S41 family peptidase [Verrucomicrobiales bacterium]MCP5558126.1 S41 family peptidase [Verrucomicrobiaceae bacterium]
MRIALFISLLSLPGWLHAQQSPPAPKPAAAPAPAKPTPKPAAPVKPGTETAKPAPITATDIPTDEDNPALTVPPPDDAYRQMELLTRAMEIIRQNYVAADKVTYEDLVEGALEGMLSRLDPHCEWMGRSVFEDVQLEQSDTSEGIGITVALRGNVLTIVTVREDGPAARAGVLAADQIVRINDVLTDTVGVAEAMQLLKGKSGESVRLTLRRPGTRQFLEFNLVRETLQETSVHDAMLVHTKLAGDHKIGYARISQFTQATVKDLSNSLDELEKQGMQAFILDLRNNPGGLLDSAVAMCGEFLPEATVVVTTEGRVASQNPPPYRTPARNGKKPRQYPIVVLINQGSASAAEITAGALQDLKRALVIGTTSFGKGSVQTILPMNNGAAMRLTTARYFTPSHRTIHEHGVEPDIVSVLSTEEEFRVAKWRNSHGTGDVAALELAELGDRQLERAVDALKGVLVFDLFARQKEASSKPSAPPEIRSIPPKLDALLGPSNVDVPADTTTPKP